MGQTWDLWMAFVYAIPSLLLLGWLFLAGILLFLKRCTIFSVVLTTLAAIPCLLAILFGSVVMISRFS
jgi:hypothetical protein